MSEYTITKLDADPDKREWSGGHFCVRKDGRSAALFLFEYPESMCKLTCTEADALAAAKSFMAINDLVAALKSVMTWVDNWEPEFTNDPEWKYDESKISEALEKAGIK